MKAQKRKIAIVVLAVLTGGVGCVFADVAATVNPGGISLYPPQANISIGYRFYVDKQITITHLGLFDAGEPGLQTTHTMALWRLPNKGRFGSGPVCQVTIGPGAESGGDNHVYVALNPPITLDPNTNPYEYTTSSGEKKVNYERWLVGVWTGGSTADALIFQPQSAVIFNAVQAGVIRFDPEYYTLKYSDTFIYPWPASGTTSDHYGVNFKYFVPGPQAEAGPDVTIFSSAQGLDAEGKPLTTIAGTAWHTNSEIPVQYQWLKGGTVLKDWEAPGMLGTACLSLAAPLPDFSIGTHTLTLEVSDNISDVTHTVSDTMTLTVYNSPPHSQPSAVQTVEIGIGSVDLEGSVSDFDGDLVSYQWMVNGELVGSSVSVTATPQGVQTTPVSISPGDPAYSKFSLGDNLVELCVADVPDHGSYTPVFGSINIVFQDTTGPKLSATTDSAILWPPNGKMRPVTISVTASDNSGGSIQLSAVVTSNESDDSGEEDWTQPVIEPLTGTISVNLRAERLGTGDGRVYTVTVTATDQSENSASVDVKVRVPHDQRKK